MSITGGEQTTIIRLKLNKQGPLRERAASTLEDWTPINYKVLQVDLEPKPKYILYRLILLYLSFTLDVYNKIEQYVEDDCDTC